MESDNDRTRSAVMLTKGTMVSQYRIVELIGSGGMGDVYLAEDTQLDRKVALKFLPPHLCRDDDCRARFKREAQAAAKLDHPNIAGIHDVGDYQGRPFYCMQVVEGRSLRELIAAEELPTDKVIDIAIQVCEGLQAAHEQGITHRDIKPSNILIDLHGRAKIVDFGLASVVGSDQLTKTGSTLGTVGYMAPEQVEGQSVDHRSDLFSLGVVLYQLITKQNPFKRDSDAATLRAVCDFTPEPIARYKRDVPGLLESITSKLLEKAPTLRYQTAADVISDLHRLQLRSATGASLRPVGRASSPLMRVFIPAAVVIVIATVLILKPWKLDFVSTDQADASENRLAIMYFDNLADSNDGERMGEIAASLLMTDMSESDYVQVVSSQRLYDILKNTGREGQKKIDRFIATQVAQKARARWMVLGNILMTEPRIVLTSELVEVATGDLVASQRIEGEADEDIFPLVDRLTTELKKDLMLPAGVLSEDDRPVADMTSHSAEAYRHYIEGLDHFYKYHTAEARNSFEQALAVDSTLAIAYYYLYKLESVVRNPGSEPWLEMAVQNVDHAGERDRYLILGADARSKGDNERAMNLYEEMVRRYPDEKEGYFRLALLYKWSLGDRKTAIGYFEKVIELDSLFSEPYNQLSYDYRDAGEFEKSYWAVNKYISLTPEEAAPYITRAHLCFYDSRFDDAIESYSMALKRSPGWEEGVWGIGNTYLHKGVPDSAKVWFAKQLDTDDVGELGFARLVIAHPPLWLGKLEQSLRIVNDGLAKDEAQGYNGEWYVQKLLLKALIHMEFGEQDSASATALRAVNHPVKIRDDELLPDLIQAWVDQGAGRDDSTAAIDIIGFTKFHDGDYSGAAIDFRTSLEEKAKWQFSYLLVEYMLGRSYLEAGQLGEAAAAFESFLAKQWHSYSMWSFWLHRAHYYLGIIYEESGWKARAIEQYRQYVDLMKQADAGAEEIEDAGKRLENLESSS